MTKWTYKYKGIQVIWLRQTTFLSVFPLEFHWMPQSIDTMLKLKCWARWFHLPKALVVCIKSKISQTEVLYLLKF